MSGIMIIALLIVGLVCFLVPAVWGLLEKILAQHGKVFQFKLLFVDGTTFRVALFRNGLFLLPQLLIAIIDSNNLLAMELFSAPLLYNLPLVWFLIKISLVFILILLTYYGLRRYYQSLQGITTTSTQLAISATAIICLIGLINLFCYWILRACIGIILLNFTPITSYLFNLIVHLSVVLAARMALRPNKFWRLFVAAVFAAWLLIYFSTMARF